MSTWPIGFACCWVVEESFADSCTAHSGMWPGSAWARTETPPGSSGGLPAAALPSRDLIAGGLGALLRPGVGPLRETSADLSCACSVRVGRRGLVGKGSERSDREDKAMHLEPLVSFDATMKTVDIGPTPSGHRMNMELTGQTRTGSRVEGAISGIDLLRLRSDGAADLDVLVMLTTPTESVVSVRWRRSNQQPDRVHLRHRAAPNPGHQRARLARRRHGDGLQAHRVRTEALASRQRTPPGRAGSRRSQVREPKARRTTGRTPPAVSRLESS
jgi:hypothetical protein